MGTLSKRGEIYWLDTTIKGKRIRQSLDTEDRRVALQRAKTLETAIWEGKAVISQEVRSVTLQEAFDELYITHWKDTKDASGVHARFVTLKTFLPSDTKVSEVTQDVVDLLVLGMKKATYSHSKDSDKRYPYSPATINRVLSVLGYILKRMQAKGLTSHVPKMPKGREKGRTRYVTEDEEKTMFHALSVSQNPNHGRCLRLFSFLADTGCRMGEATGLTWDEVLFESRMVILRDTKSGQDVGKGLTLRALGALAQELSEGRLKPFEGIGETMYRNAWDYAKKAAGLASDDTLVRHSLRHTTASRLVQRGVPLKEVQEFLGHQNIKTTLKYAHLAPSGNSNAVRALEGVQ